ncbi:hypothetical protein PGT21_012629 [Puccinia graminis f. sp. tritici]|uniref:Uncharacterized protein n=1 Tax=Puccinia graminis f. sp. tritici TaxID=56615 RepID=A0A5B0LPU5_PUCGR|nr:hypothetical protein PGT21_012629 [Puccinia graminis f. sp. tritici]
MPTHLQASFRNREETSKPLAKLNNTLWQHITPAKKAYKNCLATGRWQRPLSV